MGFTSVATVAILLQLWFCPVAVAQCLSCLVLVSPDLTDAVGQLALPTASVASGLAWTNAAGARVDKALAFHPDTYRSAYRVWPASRISAASGMPAVASLVWIDSVPFAAHYDPLLASSPQAHVIFSAPVNSASAGSATVAAGLSGVAGVTGGSGGVARFNAPTGLARGAPNYDNVFGSIPFVYIADTDNHCVRRGRPRLGGAGLLGPELFLDVSRVFGTCGSSTGVVDSPTTVAVTADGNVLYVGLSSIPTKIIRVDALLHINAVLRSATAVLPVASPVVSLALHPDLATEDDLVFIFATESGPSATLQVVTRRHGGSFVGPVAVVTPPGFSALVTSVLVLRDDGSLLVAGNGVGGGIVATCPNTVAAVPSLLSEGDSMQTFVGSSGFVLRRVSGWFPSSSVVAVAAAECAARDTTLGSIESMAEQTAVTTLLLSRRGLGSPYVLIGATGGPSSAGSWTWIDGNRAFATASSGACLGGAFCGSSGTLAPVASDLGAVEYALAMRTASHSAGAPGTWAALTESDFATLWSPQLGAAMGMFLCRRSAACTKFDCSNHSRAVTGSHGICRCECLPQFHGSPTCNTCSARFQATPYPSCVAAACSNVAEFRGLYATESVGACLFSCPTGFDPDTLELLVCSSSEYCDAQIGCTCNIPNMYGPTCATPCACIDSNVCMRSNGSCSCPWYRWGHSCEYTCPGSNLTHECSNHGRCVGRWFSNGTCRCRGGFTGVACEIIATRTKTASPSVSSTRTASLPSPSASTTASGTRSPFTSSRSVSPSVASATASGTRSPFTSSRSVSPSVASATASGTRSPFTSSRSVSPSSSRGTVSVSATPSSSDSPTGNSHTPTVAPAPTPTLSFSPSKSLPSSSATRSGETETHSNPSATLTAPSLTRSGSGPTISPSETGSASDPTESRSCSITPIPVSVPTLTLSLLVRTLCFSTFSVQWINCSHSCTAPSFHVEWVARNRAAPATPRCAPATFPVEGLTAKQEVGERMLLATVRGSGVVRVTHCLTNTTVEEDVSWLGCPAQASEWSTNSLFPPHPFPAGVTAPAPSAFGDRVVFTAPPQPNQHVGTSVDEDPGATLLSGRDGAVLFVSGAFFAWFLLFG